MISKFPKTRPSKLAEMLAEVELEGYTIKCDEEGWYAEILGEAMPIPAQPTKEDCILAAYKFLEDNGLFGRAR